MKIAYPPLISAKRPGCSFCGKVRSIPEAIRKRLAEVNARRRGEGNGRR